MRVLHRALLFAVFVGLVELGHSCAGVGEKTIGAQRLRISGVYTVVCPAHTPQRRSNAYGVLQHPTNPTIATA